MIYGDIHRVFWEQFVTERHTLSKVIIWSILCDNWQTVQDKMVVSALHCIIYKYKATYRLFVSMKNNYLEWHWTAWWPPTRAVFAVSDLLVVFGMFAVDGFLMSSSLTVGVFVLRSFQLLWVAFCRKPHFVFHTFLCVRFCRLYGDTEIAWINMLLMNVCSVGAEIASSSASVMTASSAVHRHHQQQQQPQHNADTGSTSWRGDADEMRESKLLPNTAAVDNRSLWQQHNSMNGSVPVSRHRHDSPDHSPRRLHRPDPSPYHVRMMDHSPLRQQPAERGILLAQAPLGGFSNSWNLGSSYSSYQRNGLISSTDNERMDTSDEMPLNLSTGVRSSASSPQQFASVNSRRRILTSGK